MENAKSIKGGEFIVKDVDANDIFIPEEFDEEQQMIGQTCQDFIETEILPDLDKLDSKEDNLMREKLEKAGELGLLGISLPEKYDGFEQSFVTSQLAAEKLGAGYSFAVAYSCHTGIGSLPILYYGNEEQKQKYIPKLATGEWVGAYCLTEPGAGSDANAGKTNAVLSEDGRYYILNGQKMWITNSGFADVFTVFAKIDNDRVLSAFIVEKSYPGIVLNPEEHKMGIHGSSTRQVFFNDCKVPVENLLGTRGQGFRIALNILHMGRIKLGSNVLGAAKMAINHSVNYANERKQFNSLISGFGSIKYKLAQQVIKTFTTESAVYRASRNVDEAVEQNQTGCSKEEAMIAAYAQFAVEAAILKVFGSEALDYVVDEAVQIYGGMGYSAEMPVERGYRDSRINRIFEGTNEINRILVVDTLLKRGAKHEFDLTGEAEKVMEEIKHPENLKNDASGYFERKRFFIKNYKKLALMLIYLVTNKYRNKLVYEEELLNHLADILMNLYVTESTMLRVQKLEGLKGSGQGSVYRDILDVALFDASGLIHTHAINLLNSLEDTDDYDRFANAVKILTETDRVNTKAARRRIAGQLIEENSYKF